jgi:hypothetical protein
MAKYTVCTYHPIEVHNYTNDQDLRDAGWPADTEVFERVLIAPGLERVTSTTVGALK